MRMQPRARELDKIFKRRDRYEIPDWQREEVWDRRKKQTLIDTILRGWRLPKFYLVKTSSEPEEFEVVDGQQRLQAIFEFFSNELPLSIESQALYGAEYYKDLPDEISDRFDDFTIDYDEIEDATDEELKEFFQRLQAGLPLNPSEKLNAVHSKLRNFVKTLAEHSFLKTKTTISDHRYGHFDVVAKVAALEIEGIESGLRFEDIKKVFESQSSFSSTSNIAKRLKGAFDGLNLIFPTKSSQLRNRTLVQALVTFTARFVEMDTLRGSEPGLRSFFTTFLSELAVQVELGQAATDMDYVRFQRTISANVRGGAQIRQQVLLRKLAAKNAELVAKLGGMIASQAGFGARVQELGQSIVGLVAQINSAHSATQGSDLFKMTNRTAPALTSFGKVIDDYAGYETLVDDLYFVFHEGPGQRLGQNRPPTFTDVNALRTELRHDVDHGKSGDVSKKRIRNGDVFAKYAGAASPQTLSADRFPLVHYSLLCAIEADLQKLLQAESVERSVVVA